MAFGARAAVSRAIGGSSSGASRTGARGRGVRTKAVAAGVALAVQLVTVAGWSAPTTQEVAAAEALFEEAQALLEKGEFAPACDRLEKSQKLDPQVGTLIYLATCHEQLGKTATAWIEFKDARAQAEAAGKAERVKQADEGVARVEPLLARASIKVTAPSPDEVVTINGAPVKVFETALPFDPGTLAVEATAPGKKKHTQSVELAAKASVEIVVPALEADTAAPPPSSGKDHTLAWVVGGAGLGVTALGFAFGGVAMAQQGAADDGHCDATTCDQEGLDLYDQANAFAWASNITVGVGLAAVATGVVLFFVAPGGGDDGKEKAARVVPLVVPTRGGLTLGLGGLF